MQQDAEAWRTFQRSIRDDLRPLMRLDNWHGPLAVLADYLVIAAAVLAGVRWPVALPLCVLVIGCQQRALASLMHESCHKTLTRHRRLNNALGKWAAGLPIFQSHAAYLDSHVLRHHVHLGNPDLDPDYRQYVASGLFDVRDRLDFILHLARTLLLLNLPAYVRYLVVNRLSAIWRRPDEAAGLLLVHAGLAAVLTAVAGPFGYFIFWLLPLLTSFQIVGWISEISEHYPYVRMAKSPIDMTRNRFPRWIERCFIGHHGDNYHLLHHLFPGIPFWQLPAAHQVLLRSTAYARANESAGGIFTAPPGRTPVLRAILNDIGARSRGHAPVFHT